MSMPYVVEYTDNGVTTLSLESRLMSSRIIFLKQEVDSEICNTLISQLLYLDSVSNDPIKLYIDSPGGSVISGMCLIDTFSIIKSPVYTICIGQACSMGAYILAAGMKGHRKALPNSVIMMHDIYHGVQGTAHKEAKPRFEFNEGLVTRQIKFLAKITGKTEKFARANFIDKDCWMTPEQALENGFIDEITKRD